jgi:hypothetical protein
VRHLEGNLPLQLFIVGQVNEAKTAPAQNLLDPVAADVRGGGHCRIGRAGFPVGFVYSLVGIVHRDGPPSGSVESLQSATLWGLF